MRGKVAELMIIMLDSKESRTSLVPILPQYKYNIASQDTIYCSSRRFFRGGPTNPWRWDSRMTIFEQCLKLQLFCNNWLCRGLEKHRNENELPTALRSGC